MSNIEKGLMIEQLLEKNNEVIILDETGKEVKLNSKNVMSIIYSPADKNCMVQIWNGDMARSIDLANYKLK